MKLPKRRQQLPKSLKEQSRKIVEMITDMILGVDPSSGVTDAARNRLAVIRNDVAAMGGHSISVLGGEQDFKAFLPRVACGGSVKTSLMIADREQSSTIRATFTRWTGTRLLGVTDEGAEVTLTFETSTTLIIWSN